MRPFFVFLNRGRLYSKQISELKFGPRIAYFGSRIQNKRLFNAGRISVLAMVAILGFYIADRNYAKKKINNSLNLCEAFGRGSNLRDERFFVIVSNGDCQNAQRYINSGFDVNEKHPLGFSSLHIACGNGDLEMAKLLVKNGANVNAVDETNFSNGNAGISEMLIIPEIRSRHFRGLNPSANTFGFTPLHYAVVTKNPRLVSFLVQNGANPKIECLGGEKPEDFVGGKEMKGRAEKEILNALREEADKYAQEKLKKEREYRRENPLENILKERIVGQNVPIHAVGAAIRRKQNGWADEGKPLVFLFLGSSGVGKTELAKQLAKYIHPQNAEAFIRLDLSEFQTRHEVSKFIGSPPGYVGYDEGGQLTEKLRKNPNSVVLLDEVEKAHPDVLTVMLQLFDEGRITDGRGNTVNCPDAVFVMTSNLAQREIADNSETLREQAESLSPLPGIDLKLKNKQNRVLLGNNKKTSKSFVEEEVLPILRSHFKRDEFLGRINEILVFLPFNRGELRALATIELERWAEKAKSRHDIDLNWSREVVNVVAKGYNKYYGARSIQHEVDRKIVNRLAEAHEAGLITKGSTVRIFEKEGTIGVDWAEK